MSVLCCFEGSHPLYIGANFPKSPGPSAKRPLLFFGPGGCHEVTDDEDFLPLQNRLLFFPPEPRLTREVGT